MDRDARKLSGMPLNQEIINIKPKHVFFFAGVNGGYSDLRAVKGTFDRVLGPGNSTEYNSAFLAETPSPDRYQQMARDIKQQAKEGPVVIFGHSYGAVEAIRAIYEDTEIREKYLQNITLIGITPVGFFENGWEGAKALAIYGKEIVQEARGLGLVFPGKSSILSGIASLSTMPSDVISHDTRIEAARFASPKLSHRAGVEVDFTPTRDYLSVVDERTQRKAKRADARLDQAFKDRNKRGVKREFRRRGRMKKVVTGIFKGKYAIALKDPQLEAPIVKKSAESRRLRRRLIMDSWKGRELAKMKELQGMGLKVITVMPEQDLLRQRTFGEVVSVPFTTHGSPWATQPDVLIAIMKHYGIIQ